MGGWGERDREGDPPQQYRILIRLLGNFRIFKSITANLLTTGFIQLLHFFGEQFNGFFKPTCANDIFKEFQHTIIVLSLCFGLHQSNLFHLTLCVCVCACVCVYCEMSEGMGTLFYLVS